MGNRDLHTAMADVAGGRIGTLEPHCVDEASAALLGPATRWSGKHLC